MFTLKNREIPYFDAWNRAARLVGLADVEPRIIVEVAFFQEIPPQAFALSPPRRAGLAQDENAEGHEQD